MKLANLEKIISNSLHSRNHLGLEITVTQQCNCRCSYCFEHDSLCGKSFQRNYDEEARQLHLVKTFCQMFDVEKNERLTITFWGGEPMLNQEFIEQIIESTIDYDFVYFYVFTNGTLTDEIQNLLQNIGIRRMKKKIHFQLSYDGEPHNRVKRGQLSSTKVLQTARLLKKLGIPFSFKSTLSFDMLSALPKIWKSYEKLFEEFGVCARYSPTLDMCEDSPSQQNLESWKNVLVEIAKLELKFFRKHGMTLMKCFDYGSKRVCDPTKSVMMHVDGKLYLCHGCAYLSTKDHFQISDTKMITNLEEAFQKMENVVSLDQMNEDCKHCPAVWCTSCHANYVDPNNIHDDWLMCISRPKARCQYLKIFGLVARALNLCKYKTEVV